MSAIGNRLHAMGDVGIRQSAIDRTPWAMSAFGNRSHASDSLVYRGKGSRTRVSLDDTGYSKARVLMVPASRSPKGAPVHLLLQAGKALLVATRLVLQAHVRSVSRVGLAPLLLELAAERGLGGGAGNHV
jgi:mRNA-degrading endonuclease toxin of MazEF toxin-antitoxin module